MTFHRGRIEISRTRWGALHGARPASLAWKQVIAVDFLDPRWYDDGHVHFVTASDTRGLSTVGIGDPLAVAPRNPHAIVFRWQQRAVYRRLQELLDREGRE